MSNSKKAGPGRFTRFAAAALAVTLALGMRLALTDLVGLSVPYLTFFPAVLFSAWFGGLWPGLFASFLSLSLLILVSIFGSEAILKPSLSDMIGGLLFLAVCAFISMMTEALRRSRARSDQRLEELQAETSRRAKAETALAEASRQAERDRDLFRTTLASIGDCIIAVDPACKVTFLNSAAEQLTGWAQADAAGRAIREILPVLNERTRQPVDSPATRAMEEVITVDGDDTILTTRDGREIPIEERAAPIRDEQHKAIAGAVVVFRDVTQRRESQRHLKQMNEDLSRANRGLEEFAYVASHDLQEPLRIVGIYTQMTLRSLKQPDEQTTKYAGFVLEGVKRMEALIGDLLHYSRVSHNDDSPPGKADLTASLQQAMTVLAGEIKESGAEIQWHSLPHVQGATSQLSHVFQNLLSNAIKYRLPDARPKIWIEADRTREHWTVSMKDNGIGFDQQHSERIFGLFKRLHKDEYPGTGLGLAICQRIVERYGGRIWAESKPGEGSTFRFTLIASDKQE